MSNYTPGPWFYQSSESYTCGILYGKTEVVCDFITDPRSENARLISAAPELLEALQQALAWIDGENTPIDKLSKARELVAKITGATHE